MTLVQQEQENNERPQIKTAISNIEQYYTIFVGFPMWWSDMPQILYTFFDEYDLAGKNIIPFCTHAVSELTEVDTLESIKELQPVATVKEGLSIRPMSST